MGDLFASIKRGLEEAIAHQKGEKTGIRLFTPEEVNVKQVREKTGLTRQQFAATFGISLGTLRHWERGDRRPHGPALVLLNAVAKEPGTGAADIDRREGCERGAEGEEKLARAG
jgi:putative transcriptional regulator